MNVALFSAGAGLVASVAIVGTVLFFVGGCRALGAMGENRWLFLVPLYGPYLLFRGARCVVLFAAALVCLGAVGAFWAMPTGFLQQFWVVFAVLGWLCYAWCVAAFAECFHAGIGWQVAAFLLAPFVLALVAADGEPFDHGCVPVITAPFRSLEGCLWEKDETAELPLSDDVAPVEVLGLHEPTDAAPFDPQKKGPDRDGA